MGMNNVKSTVRIKKYPDGAFFIVMRAEPF